MNIYQIIFEKIKSLPNLLGILKKNIFKVSVITSIVLILITQIFVIYKTNKLQRYSELYEFRHVYQHSKTNERIVSLINNSISDLADNSHSHSDLADSLHSHSNLAYESHSHSNLAESYHFHSDLADSYHSHSDLADSLHSHSNLAQSYHFHD